MRLFLLLFVLVAGSVALESTLLVLRAACPLSESAAFDLQWLSRRPATRALRLLSHTETCGPGWRHTVTRASLAAFSAGRTVEAVGWPSFAACNLLSAAARALRRPQPAACAVPGARAAVVLNLAHRFGWRYALVPPAPPSSECEGVLWPIVLAFINASFVVRRDRISASWRPHVIIWCASSTLRYDSSSQNHDEVEVLLLHVEEDEDFLTATALDSDKGTANPHFERNSESLSVSESSPNNIINPIPEWELSSPLRRVLAISIKLPPCPVLVLAGPDEGRPLLQSVVAVHDQALVAVENMAMAERTRWQTMDNRFLLYGRGSTDTAWRLVVTVTVKSKFSLDNETDSITNVKLLQFQNSLDLWDHTRSQSSYWELPTSALIAVVVLMAAIVTIYVARYQIDRIRGPQFLSEIVLPSADFSFPAEEPRCVGGGMETMLTCWLQQLHEFGGPELEKPDLLKRPVGVSLVPSAPSSTCSVNRVPPERYTRYKEDIVFLKRLPLTAIDLKRKTLDVLLDMRGLRHENVNLFLGCLCEVRPALVWAHCGRGSLEDVLTADDIKLDWTFRLSLLTDLVKGMRYLHASRLCVHGALSSRNCVVDSRWVLRITDYGLPCFYQAQSLPLPVRTARDLLWTAPELLRDEASIVYGCNWRASQPGDVFAFGIVMQEVIVRGEPYCMLALTPEEIVEKLRRPPPLIRPSVSIGAAPPEAVNVMRQCWSESPDLRPDFDVLHDVFRRMHRGKKINIVDSMFEMLEKYSNNLEELIKERTEQLDIEKKKTEQLLNRMLPRSVAERLVLGSRVEPEEFQDVTVYFSDIVGFTALAALSTPVQVVDLLNDLYTTFDAAIERYHVYKVETIGDAYMVVGGLPVRACDHAESVATMALHLLHLAGRFRVRHLPATPLHLRSGLHSGPCCAGVVGLTMPRYCLFGDTVNTASRMESTGAAWRIQVSETTAERLADAGGYVLQSRGHIQIKGKGVMHTYWLLGKEGFERPLPTPPPLEYEDNALIGMQLIGEKREAKSSHIDTPPLDSVNSHGAKDSSDRPAVLSLSGHEIQRERYRWLPGARPFRRQWSLEGNDTKTSATTVKDSLTLLMSTGPTPTTRYRTRVIELAESSVS